MQIAVYNFDIQEVYKCNKITEIAGGASTLSGKEVTENYLNLRDEGLLDPFH